MRRRLRVRRLESYDCLVEVRPGAPGRPPLFLLCWTGGKLIAYHDLVERLPADQPVYGLRAPTFDGRTHRFASLEELAALFSEEIQRFWPEPPYFLAGYCFGGTLAHEVASQMAAADLPTAFLGMIESSPYGHGEPRRPRPSQLTREIAWFRAFVKEPFGRKARLLSVRLFGRWSWWRKRLRRGAYSLVLRTGWVWPGRLWNLNLLEIRSALLKYRVPRTDMRITLFEAHDPNDGPLEPTVWTRLVDQVELHVISAPGIGHVSIMWRPYVEQLSEQFNERLSAAVVAAPLGLAVPRDRDDLVEPVSTRRVDL